MTGPMIIRGNRVGWRMAALAIVAVTLVVATQGCCSWARKNCRFPATHSVVFAVDLEHDASCVCPNADCVCPTPMVVEHARRGDKLQFVNASPYEVTVRPALAEAFVGRYEVTLDPDEIATVTLSDSLPTGTGFNLNIEVPQGRFCPGQPGPRVDIDD